MNKVTLKEIILRKYTICHFAKLMKVSRDLLYKLLKFDKSAKLGNLQKLCKLLNVRIVIDKNGVRYE